MAILLVVRQDDADGAKHHPIPLSGGDSKAFAKEFGRTRAMDRHSAADKEDKIAA